MKCDNCANEIVSGERLYLETQIYKNDPLSNYKITKCVKCAEEQGKMPNATAGGSIDIGMVQLAAILHNRPETEELKKRGGIPVYPLQNNIQPAGYFHAFCV